MNGNLLLRSFMFLPAYNRKFIDKALQSDADALIFDLEDAVPPIYRQDARNNIIEYSRNRKFTGKKIFIRINEIGTKDFAEDINQMILDGITGFMPSKISDAGDIYFLDRLLSMQEVKYGLDKGTFLLAPLIETTKAVLNAYEIAKASSRMVAICLGGEDYLNDLGSTYSYYTPAFSYPRATIVNAARAAEILPIDTPYLNINDLEGFRIAEKEAYKNGFSGCLLLNPKQIKAANTVFSPDKDEIEYSQNLIKAFEETMGKQDIGIAMYQGIMIGPPMLKRARYVVNQRKLIEEQYQKGNIYNEKSEE